MAEIKCILNNITRSPTERAEEAELISQFGVELSREIHKYHKSMPGYEETPLQDLKGLASFLNINKVLVKDESKRFGLNAFKVLGSSYALARHLAGHEDWPLTFKEVAGKVSSKTLLVTATDGNHGYGVAFLAKLYKCRAKILMPSGTVPNRAERIRKLGAECDILKENYDTCVELARKMALDLGGLYIQDTALDTDTEEERKIPLNIMQGYNTILQEVISQMPYVQPTHVFLQVGVGSFSGALAAHLQMIYSKPPTIVIVEAAAADCVYKSAEAGDGKMRCLDGEMVTIMAGLNCGVPSVQGWPILRATASAFLSCQDIVSARGIRVLNTPRPGDGRVISGESGSVPLGALYTICTHEDLEDVKAKLGLDANSTVLVVSTEGDTDPEGFYSCVWA